MKPLFASVLISIAVLGGGAANAENAASSAFQQYCQEKLTDIPVERRICVIGVVQDTTHLRVLIATKPRFTDQTVEVYGSPPQSSAKNPLSDMKQNMGHVVALGGFENPPVIYSAKRL